MRIILTEYKTKDIIKFVRQATGLTQKQFGEKIGKSRNTIQSYELGRIKMSFEDFIRICKMFNMKLTLEEKIEVKQ